MTVRKAGFPSILPDNDMFYLNYVITHLEKIDPGCTVSIVKALHKIVFDVLPSDFFRKKMVVNEVIRMHTLLGLEPEFSKTLEFSPSVYFSLVDWK